MYVYTPNYTVPGIRYLHGKINVSVPTNAWGLPGVWFFELIIPVT